MKYGWKPSEIEEWLDCEPEMKALYFAAMEKKAEYDKKAKEDIKNNRTNNRGKGKKK